MTNRPSTSPPTLGTSEAEGESGASLRFRLVGLAAVGAVVLLGGLTFAGLTILRKAMAGDENARIENAASLSTQLVDRVLSERARQVELVAAAPSVIDAAKKGAAEAKRAGLPAQRWTGASKETLAPMEKRFGEKRSLDVDAGTKAYLTALLPKLGIAEVMVTDQSGYNAVTTSLSGDFIQSDEDWWTTAWSHGSTTANATIDAVSGKVVVELAGIVRDGSTPVGVVKVKFGLGVVDTVLAQGSVGGAALRVDLVDSAGKVIASSAGGDRFTPFAAFKSVAAQDGKGAFTYSDTSRGAQPEVGAVYETNGGKWHVVAHMNEAQAARAYNLARWALLGGAVVMLVLIIGALFYVARFIERRITGPASELAMAAEAVAAGDLSKSVSAINANDEIGRLAHAVAAMIGELRRLAIALNESSSETTSMTAEITASSEEMAASAGQIAHTAADLSQQANLMAETIQTLAGSSEHLVSLATTLDAGATEGVERNTKLRSLAVDNRARLDDSSRSLAALSKDAEESAASIEQLAQASEEIRSFVTLVQKLARQSKLLALNAAMEAARAGEHGHGFAVVAEEVRRLSAMSSDAAERTERVVTNVLTGISQSRTSSERTLETARAVRGATEEGSRSFGDIEKTVAEADGWTASIQKAVIAANELAHGMRAKLDSLATGTESFAAAMEEVAASSEEQSASTEQIAAAAGTLSGAAERLTRVVSNLRLDEHAPHGDAKHRPSNPVRLPDGAGIGRPTPARSSMKI
jgi:methyl-accepting chemotaxis protein